MENRESRNTLTLIWLTDFERGAKVIQCGKEFLFKNVRMCVAVQSLNHVQLFCNPMDCIPPGLLCPWDFPRQEHWSGKPFPSPGDFPDPVIEPASPVL